LLFPGKLGGLVEFGLERVAAAVAAVLDPVAGVIDHHALGGDGRMRGS